jgi:hypothetical protein
MHIQFLSRRRFHHTVSWAVLFSCLIVAVAATLARATLNLAGALVNRPDIAVLLLLPQEDIRDSAMIRETPQERDYLLQTRSGPKLARLHRGVEHWFVAEVVPLHE